MTEHAGTKLTSLLTRQGRPQGALRVAVIGGGCSGLQYKMDLVDGPANRDIMVESAGVRVVIDPKSALFVSGSLLDFSDDLQKGGFKVTNPNAVAHCSCGESFSALGAATVYSLGRADEGQRVADLLRLVDRLFHRHVVDALSRPRRAP